MQEQNDLSREYLNFSHTKKRLPRGLRLAHALLNLILFPAFWAVAGLLGAPGLRFRTMCAVKGLGLMTQGDFLRAYRLLTFPLDSVRYFEFDFFWRAVGGSRVMSYLDVSSPRLLPLFILDRSIAPAAALVNPDASDLAETAALAKSFGVQDRCLFHGCLLEQAPLAPSSFDLITSMSVIEHIPDDAAAIRRMWSLLRPGGVLLITVPCAARASEEYTDVNEYKILQADEGGHVFWQRYYDEALLQSRIFQTTGKPQLMQVYGEIMAGSYRANVRRKMSGGWYPHWREPLMMAHGFEYKRDIASMSGMGVVAMKFVKP